MFRSNLTDVITHLNNDAFCINNIVVILLLLLFFFHFLMLFCCGVVDSFIISSVLSVTCLVSSLIVFYLSYIFVVCFLLDTHSYYMCDVWKEILLLYCYRLVP